jgi:hypothetical protein
VPSNNNNSGAVTLHNSEFHLGDKLFDFSVHLCAHENVTEIARSPTIFIGLKERKIAHFVYRVINKPNFHANILSVFYFPKI